MKTADIYIRVSTDEQAHSGFSLRSQEERLRNYCLSQNINIHSVIVEDYSAKTFKRPAWSKLFLSWKKDQNQRPDLLLFTRWDRFSRNTADAYYVIRQAEHMGIELQAIDQPLDLSVPENKIMLAMYIVSSEVENDRRSLNIRYGLHKARKEGRWPGLAPIGYINRTLSDGHKYIIPHEPEASLIKQAFAMILDNSTNIRALHRQMANAGLKCSLSNFWKLTQNSIYCGKIHVAEMEGVAAHEVKGVHEPLITEELFNKAQHVLKSRKRVFRFSHTLTDEKLPLRGFLYCPICSKRLTGSGSKGYYKRYYYYHCVSGCSYRVRADKINQLLINGLSDLVINQKYISISQKIAQDTFHKIIQRQSNNQVDINRSIDRFIHRILNAKELLLTGQIENDDYIAIKTTCENSIHTLGIEIQQSNIVVTQREHRLIQIVRLLSSPYELYHKLDFANQRKLLSLLLLQQLVFDELEFHNNLTITASLLYINRHVENEVWMYDKGDSDIINDENANDPSLIFLLEKLAEYALQYT